MIFKSLSLILEAISFRASIKLLASNIFNNIINIPCWQSVRLWFIRLGYYKLHLPKEKSSDWIWVIDHCVQLGTDKCLVILGIRQKDLPKDRALQHADMEIISLIPVRKSNGDIIYGQLESAAEKTGIPYQIVADKGSDLKCGIDKFIEKNNTVVYVHDMKHAIAIILKKNLCDNQDWIDFLKLMSDTKNKIKQTVFSALTPISIREKSRYMNIDSIIKWAYKILTLVKNPDLLPDDMRKNLAKFKEKFFWVLKYEELIIDLNESLKVIKEFEHYLRTQQVSKTTLTTLIKSLPDTGRFTNATIIKNNIIHYIENTLQGLREKEKYLFSSEIIESLFGKFKYLEKEYSKSGFTSLVLALPALVGVITPKLIKTALESSKVADINKWVKANLGDTVQSTKKTILNKLKTFFNKSGNKIELIAAA